VRSEVGAHLLATENIAPSLDLDSFGLYKASMQILLFFLSVKFLALVIGETGETGETGCCDSVTGTGVFGKIGT
jgi:hypothetical protein